MRYLVIIESDRNIDSPYSLLWKDGDEPADAIDPLVKDGSILPEDKVYVARAECVHEFTAKAETVVVETAEA